MTIIGCLETGCMYNRESQTPEEKQIATHVCGKEFIILEMYKRTCGDYEHE